MEMKESAADLTHKINIMFLEKIGTLEKRVTALEELVQDLIKTKGLF